MDEVIGDWDNEIFIGVKKSIAKKLRRKVIKKRISGTEKEYCFTCDCYYQKRIRAQHKRTKKHIKNLV